MSSLTQRFPHVGAAHEFAPADVGLLLMRIVLGGLLLLHGLSKATQGIGEIVGMLQQHGLPGAMAYLAYVGEIAAPILLMVGIWARPAAAVIAINMLFAVALAHMGDLGKMNEHGGWALELQAFYLGTALVLVLTGPGRLSPMHREPAV